LQAAEGPERWHLGIHYDGDGERARTRRAGTGPARSPNRNPLNALRPE
jgi:hypothetical protein